MTSALIPTRLKNPCKICGNTDGRCREADFGFLCMVVTSGDVPGYRFVRMSKDNDWAIYAESDGEKVDSDEWQKRNELRRQREENHAKNSLKAGDRHELYSDLLSQLSLDEVDYKDLVRRGLDDDTITKLSFKSVTQQQRLKKRLSPNLPGVSSDGWYLTTGTEGYLCPVRNVKGQIVALQVRSRVKGDSNKYRWLSSRSNPATLPVGELPVSVFPVDGSSVVGLCEGTASKPLIASIRLGFTFIGASGGNFTASSKTLLKTLEYLSPSEIYFYPDSGSILNPSILKKYQTTFALLSEFGYSVKVAWWNQVFKGCDVDELYDYSTIELITEKQFWGKCSTKAITDYQAITKVLGVKRESLSASAIDIRQLVAKLEAERDLIQYRIICRQLMYEIGIDWSCAEMVRWLSERNLSNYDQMRLIDVRDLKAKLTTDLDKKSLS